MNFNSNSPQKLNSTNLKLPEGGTVHVHHLQPVGVLLAHPAKILGRLLVLVQLKVALAQQAQHPAGAGVLLWQLLDTFHSLAEVEPRHFGVHKAQLFEQGHEAGGAGLL